jgi:MoaA/NifB/PqqE/SkfB family radical SAM enzyme
MKAFCEYPFQRLKIDPEGDTTLCCFHDRKCLGNIIEKGFDGIWNSDLAKEIRQATLRDSLHRTCSASTCPFISKQKYLHKLHKEFKDFGYPIQLEIDLPTQHCNIGGEDPTNSKHLACLMCERFWRFIPQQDRLDEVCAIIKPRIQQFKWLHVQGVAEPFWKDRVFELIEKMGAWDNRHDLQITTTTNGTILTEERIDRWYQLPHNVITFSIDAATPATYKALRRLDVYDKVIERLKKCAARRSPGQSVHIHNNINTFNVKEVVGMVEVAAEAQVNLLDFNPTYGVPGICVDESNLHMFRRAETQIIEASKSLGVNTTFTRKMTLDLDRPEWIGLL